MLVKMTEWFRVVTPVALFWISAQTNAINSQFAQIQKSVQSVNDKLDHFSLDISQRVAKLEATQAKG